MAVNTARAHRKGTTGLLGVVLLVFLTSVAAAFQKYAGNRLTEQIPNTLQAKILPTTQPSIKLTPPESGFIPGATVQRDQATGTLRRVRGDIPIKGARTAFEAAQKLLSAYSAKLGLSPSLSEIQLDREVVSLTGYHENFVQVYNGFVVHNGYLSVHTDKNLHVKLVNQDLIEFARPAALPAPRNAVAAVRTAVLAVNAQFPPTTQPIARARALVQNGAPIAVWKVNFSTRLPGASWEVMIDGQSGQVISIRNIAQYANGTGKVYDSDPVRVTGNVTLQDNDNADSLILTNARKLVALQGLDSTGFLQGQYATTETTSGVTRVQSASHTYDFTRSQTGFEETMGYYHVDTIERYIQGIGFNNINNRQIGVDINAPIFDSYYDPFSQDLHFGTVGVDFAEDADVIWHETGHAIQDNQVPGWGQTEEGGAMGEGFGDYWACSHHAGIGPGAPGWDPLVGMWIATGFNPGPPPFSRTVDGAKHYPEDLDGNVYDDGELWSACLWQIRAIVGKTRADKLILESHFLLDPFAEMVDGANAVLDANDALYGGLNYSQILAVFVNRGILQQPPAVALTITPDTIESGDSATGLVTLGGPAPPGGATIALSPDDPAAIVPPSVFVPAGKRKVKFEVRGADSVPATTTVTVTATFGADSGDATITVIPFVYGVLFDPFDDGADLFPAWEMYGGYLPPLRAWVFLNFPAPEGGQVVSLASTDPNVATVTPSVTIPSGSSAVSFVIFTLPQSTTTTAGITATAKGSTQSAPLTIDAPIPVSITAIPKTVTGGTNANAFVQMSAAAPPSGIQLTLTSSNPAVASVPATYTVPAGKTYVTFPIATFQVGALKTVNITAGTGGPPVQTSLTVTPVAQASLASLIFNPSTVSGGTFLRGTVVLSRPAPTGGVPIGLSKVDPGGGIKSLPSVTIPGGIQQISFYVPTNVVATDANATITATYGTGSKSAAVKVRAPYLLSLTILPTSIRANTSATGRVFLSGPPIAPVTVPLTYSTAATGSITGPSSVVVPAGQSVATFIVTAHNVTTATTFYVTGTYPVGTTANAPLLVFP